MGSSRLIFPKSWGEIPLSAPRDVEIEWVHQNKALCVGIRNGKATVRWAKARSPIPSYGAADMMRMAARDEKGWRSMLFKSKGEGEGEEDRVHHREERVKIEEMERILSKLREGI